VAALEAEVREVRRALAQLRSQERALRAADHRALEALLPEQEALAHRLGALEQERSACLGDLARALGVSGRALTLTELAARLPHTARALGRVGADLRAALGNLAARVEANAVLADHALGCLRGLLASIVAALTPAPTYGGRPAVAAAHLVDRRA
jgi:hypothetical protein